MNEVKARTAKPPPVTASGRTLSAEAAEAASLLEAAIATFRQLLPEHGLKLIVPPPLPRGCAAQIALSVWRRGCVSVPVHRGRDASDAMLLLLASEAERDRQSFVQKSCARCRGVGWTITPAGVREMCPHPKNRR